MQNIFGLIGILIALSTASAQSVVTYVSTDVPVPISDGPNGRGESTITIDEFYLIQDLNVVVTIMHTFDRDLRIYLDAPNNDVVRLAYECGQSGDNYIDTHFDDEASIDICSGSPPFTGSFRPDRALDLLDETLTHGTWTLRVTDNFTGDTGTIQAWSMEVTTDTSLSSHTAPHILDFSVGQNYPNPFNATTTLPITLEKSSRIGLRVFNLLGQSVHSNTFDLSAGRYSLPVDASSWTSGSYFAEVSSQNHHQTIRMQLLK